VVATNANGSDTSEVVEVTLAYPPPQIVTQPAPVAAEEGSTATFTVAANGLGSLSFQWFKDADPLSGETSETLELTGVEEGDEGSYWVRITDDAATVDGLPATVADSQIAVLTVYPAPAGLISHDAFDPADGYVAGELPGQNPAIPGFAEAWTDVDFGDAEPAVTAGSLLYPDPLYLGSSGDKAGVPNNVTGGEITAANSGRVYRLLEGPLQATPATSGTRYLSFLFQSGQETGATVYQMLHLNQGDGDINRNFDLGLTTNGGMTGAEYTFGTAGLYSSTGVAADTGVRLFVVKFDLSTDALSDSVTVWVDPVLGGAGDPAGGVVVTGNDLTWDRLCLSDYDGNSAAWDEIRWGTTFDSVTLNPDPADDFAAWIAGYNVGSLNGFNDDADGDGIKNGVENIFGTDPSVANQGVTAVAKTGSTVTFQHPQGGSPASDVTAAYKWSTDLATFHASGAASGGTTVTLTPALNTPSAGITTVTATITGTQPAKLFLTLEASQP
jgi:hypothetical protein